MLRWLIKSSVFPYSFLHIQDEMSETTIWGWLEFILLRGREDFLIAPVYCGLAFLINPLLSSSLFTSSVLYSSFRTLVAFSFLCFERLHEKCICCRISAYNAVIGNSHPRKWLKACCLQSTRTIYNAEEINRVILPCCRMIPGVC